jgi:hypothetical protein
VLCDVKRRTKIWDVKGHFGGCLDLEKKAFMRIGEQGVRHLASRFIAIIVGI